MANIDQYINAFVEVFGVNASTLNDDFSKESVDTWDSVHQINFIAFMEESFDVMFDPEDIMEFTSYGKGREILKRYDVGL